MTTRIPAKCGTDSGYYRHRRTLKEEPCDACKAAHAAAIRPVGAKRWSPAKCGTDSGYFRHLRTLKNEPCDACRAAHLKAYYGGRKPKPKRTCTRCGGEVRRADQEKCYGCREIETAELKAQRLAQRDRERERLASAEKAADDDRAHEPRWVRRGLVWYAVKPTRQEEEAA